MTTVMIELDKVREAAKTSPEAKAALQVLVPEAFEVARERVKTQADSLAAYDAFKKALQSLGFVPYLLPRAFGSLAKQGFYLDSYFDWQIEVDNEGVNVLTARKKQS